MFLHASSSEKCEPLNWSIFSELHRRRTLAMDHSLLRRDWFYSWWKCESFGMSIKSIMVHLTFSLGQKWETRPIRFHHYYIALNSKSNYFIIQYYFIQNKHKQTNFTWYILLKIEILYNFILWVLKTFLWKHYVSPSFYPLSVQMNRIPKYKLCFLQSGTFSKTPKQLPVFCTYELTIPSIWPLARKKDKNPHLSRYSPDNLT